MNRSLSWCALCAVAVPALFVSAADLPSSSSPPIEGESHVVTLYAHDDLLSAFDFETGEAGARIEAGELALDRAHMVFDRFAPNMLTFGFVRTERVNIIDLGDFEVPGQERAKDPAPVLPVSVFHTLFLDGGHFAYVGPNEKVQRFSEANRILDPLPAQGLYHLAPQLGHTYLVRFHRRKVGSPDEYAKFQVIDLRPGASVTIRWAPVPGA